MAFAQSSFNQAIDMLWMCCCYMMACSKLGFFLKKKIYVYARTAGHQDVTKNTYLPQNTLAENCLVLRSCWVLSKVYALLRFQMIGQIGVCSSSAWKLFMIIFFYFYGENYARLIRIFLITYFLLILLILCFNQLHK